MKESLETISSPTEDVNNNIEQRKQVYLSQGFIDASKFDNGTEFVNMIGNKKITAVYYKSPESEIIPNLKIKDFSDLRGTGFKIPGKKGGILLISRYSTNSEADRPPEGWLFKIE